MFRHITTDVLFISFPEVNIRMIISIITIIIIIIIIIIVIVVVMPNNFRAVRDVVRGN